MSENMIFLLGVWVGAGLALSVSGLIAECSPVQSHARKERSVPETATKDQRPYESNPQFP